MKQLNLTQNENKALVKLKEFLDKSYQLLDFRLYGSKARGDSGPYSDIDVMIELEDYSPAIMSEIDDMLFEINLEFDCFISLVVFSQHELVNGPLSESPLYKAATEEGVQF